MTGFDGVLETLNQHYIFDTRGRISGATTEGVLPRFLLGRAAEGCVWRFRADLEEETVVSLARLAGRESGARFDGELPAPPERLAALERLLPPRESGPGDFRGPPSRILVTRAGVVVGEIWQIA